MSDIQKVIDKINAKPYVIRMGCNKIASWLGVSSHSVKEAKKAIYKERMMTEVPKNKLNPHSVPKILLLDIETAPNSAYIWSFWHQDIYLDQIISTWFILTWSAKWLLEDAIFSQKLTSEEAVKEDDKRIVETLWHLLNEADIVIAHNGERYDVPRIKTRFILHGLPPTTFYQQVDTLKAARREFDFPSNKLDGLAKFFGIEPKMPTGIKLWTNCMKGDPDSLKYMEDYNKEDVRLLEEVYLKLRPYIKAHPNYNLYIDSEDAVCPHCGGKDLVFAGYYYFTQTGKYRNYRCTSCGALSRERKTIFKNSKSILVSNGK